LNPPAWLREFHRQWKEIRGSDLRSKRRPFSRKWEDLLDAAGLHSAAERTAAAGEALALRSEGRILVRHHKYRPHILESVSLQEGAGDWLSACFGDEPAPRLLARSLGIVRDARAPHPRHPDVWDAFCGRILAAFDDGRNLPPFRWNDPPGLSILLRGARELTSREWAPGTPVREASSAIGFDSKFLENHAPAIESALAALFGAPCPLESLGIVGGESRVLLHGPLRLLFTGETVQDFDGLRGSYSLSLTDLVRATSAETRAERILSIENAKTTFLRAAARNGNGSTLLVATSYPSRAVRRLLGMLPASLPHFHFGDTDVPGFAILRSLRRASARPVRAFLMRWHDDPASPLLSGHDLGLLSGLLDDPLMADCERDLRVMLSAGRKGRFEQEALGPPTITGWPFWEMFTDQA